MGDTGSHVLIQSTVYKMRNSLFSKQFNYARDISLCMAGNLFFFKRGNGFYNGYSINIMGPQCVILNSLPDASAWNVIFNICIRQSSLNNNNGIMWS